MFVKYSVSIPTPRPEKYLGIWRNYEYIVTLHQPCDLF